MTGGPFVETKDLIAGWYIIDVESRDRAVQLARELSAAPGPAASRSTNGSRFGRFWPTRPRSPSERALLRDLVPAVIGVLVRRGADFASAEDAVQDRPGRGRARVAGWIRRKGWLVTVAWRKFLDAARADTSRRHREVRIEGGL